MSMGSVAVRIDGAEAAYGRLLVTGERFTEFSRILIGDQMLETSYIDSEHIIAPVADTAAIESFCVAQVAKDGTVLGRTEEWTIGGAAR